MIAAHLARTFAGVAMLILLAGRGADAQQRVTQSARLTTAKEELLELESRWNVAHVYADTTTLFRLWAEDIIVIVPEMRPFTKDDLKSAWRSGRSHITRYETSDVTVRGYDLTAVVEGTLIREQSISSHAVTNHWRYTKIYVKRDGEWKVVSYHASPLPAER